MLLFTLVPNTNLYFQRLILSKRHFKGKSTHRMTNEFAQAKSRLASLKSDTDNDTKLRLYALFKQVRPVFRTD